MNSRLRRAAEVVRGQDWWFYKIPPLLATGYATSLVFQISSYETLVKLCGTVIAICLVASFGYVLNDISDVAQDHASGKRNTMRGVGAGKRFLLCAVPVGAAFAILHTIGAGAVPRVLLAANFLLPALYSLPPVRLKERGLPGALADACGVHAVPTALVVTTVASSASNPELLGVTFAISVCAWALFSGLRGIITHQIADREADSQAGVVTFGGRLGRQKARELTFRVVFPCEIVSLAVWLVIALPTAPVAGILMLVYGGAEIGKIRAGWKLPLFESPAGSREPYIPLLNNELYEVWLPIGLALQLALRDAAFIALPVFQIVAFFPNLRRRVGVLVQLWAPRRAQRLNVHH